jgi:hypothetical protein
MDAKAMRRRLALPKHFVRNAGMRFASSHTALDHCDQYRHNLRRSYLQNMEG